MTDATDLTSLRFHAPESLHKRMDALLSAENAPELVAALDAFELHEIIRGVGLSDATDLAHLATPEQIQRFIDFDAWRHDSFTSRAFEDWLEVYLSLDDQRFEYFYLQIDPEIIPLYLKQHLIVHLTDEHGMISEDIEGPVEPSPDRTYFIEYPDDARAALLCRTLITRVYDVLGVMKGWAVLESTRWEVRVEMSEMAFRFRTQRLQDHGFLPRAEALGVLVGPSPETLAAEAIVALAEDTPLPLRAGEVSMPRAYARALLARQSDAEGDLLSRCLARVSPEVWAQLRSQLVALGNVVASARGVEPGERDAAARLFEHAMGEVNIGLEFLTSSDLDRALLLLERMPVRKLFQAGYGLISRLGQQAEALVSRGRVTLTDAPASLLAEDERALIDGLRRRPALRDAVNGARFTTHQHIEQAALRLARAGFKEAFFFDLLRFNRDELAAVVYLDGLNIGPEAVQFETLLATLIIREHLDDAPGIEPLSVAQVPTGEQLGPIFDRWGARHLPPEGSPLRRHAAQLLDDTRRRVIEDLGGLTPPVDPRFVSALLIVD